ncbi:MAG: hypothetical protein ACI9TP_002257, partial [Candidatus Azotimanducaceae bacterium]
MQGTHLIGAYWRDIELARSSAAPTMQGFIIHDGWHNLCSSTLH